MSHRLRREAFAVIGPPRITGITLIRTHGGCRLRVGDQPRPGHRPPAVWSNCLIVSWAYDIAPITYLRRLEWLFLVETPFSDLGPITELSRLRLLSLGGRDRVIDLTTVASLPRLRQLYLLNVSEDTDLTPLDRHAQPHDSDVRRSASMEHRAPSSFYAHRNGGLLVDKRGRVLVLGQRVDLPMMLGGHPGGLTS
jgi:hypothetical protein